MITCRCRLPQYLMRRYFFGGGGGWGALCIGSGRRLYARLKLINLHSAAHWEVYPFTTNAHLLNTSSVLTMSTAVCTAPLHVQREDGNVSRVRRFTQRCLLGLKIVWIIIALGNRLCFSILPYHWQPSAIFPPGINYTYLTCSQPRLGENKPIGLRSVQMRALRHVWLIRRRRAPVNDNDKDNER